MRYTSGRGLAVAAAYAALLANHGDGLASWGAFALLFVAPFVASLVGGPWVALALPVAVLISVPAGYGSGDAEIPVWFGMMFVAPFALPVIVLGSATRWFVTWYARREGRR